MMGDNQYTPPANRNNNKPGCIFWSIVFAIALAIFVGAVAFLGHDKIAKVINLEEDCASQEIVDTIAPVPTVQDVLQFRYNIRESQRIDSVFMAIPDAVLVDILMTHGTCLSNTDIVSIYESNRERYSIVNIGALIQKEVLDNSPTDTIQRE